MAYEYQTHGPESEGHSFDPAKAITIRIAAIIRTNAGSDIRHLRQFTFDEKWGVELRISPALVG